MVDREESRLKAMDLTKLTEDDLFVSQDDDWGSRSFIHDQLKNSSLVTKKPTGSYFEFEENTIDKDYISCHLIIPVVVSKAKPRVSHSVYLESDESEIEFDEEESEVLEEDEYDLGVGPTPEEIAAAKKTANEEKTAAKKAANEEKTASEKTKTFASSGVKPTKEPEPSKKDDLRKTELVAEYDWAMEEAAAWNKENMRFDELSHKHKFLTFRHASDPDTYPVPDYFEYLPSHVKNAEMKYKQKVFDKHI